ncbi:MAG: hypothetical protein R2856_36540 [Caldilineaceae bacterium]
MERAEWRLLPGRLRSACRARPQWIGQYRAQRRCGGRRRIRRATAHRRCHLRWVDSGDQKAVFWNQYFAAYQEAHPNITIQYDALPWNEIAQVVPLAQRHRPRCLPDSNWSHTPAQAVQEGWAAALDDIVPNFAEWEGQLPARRL